MEQPVRATRSLKGRVAIVTGAGAAGDGIGNGRAAAILLAEDGATVVCVDVAHDPVARTVAMIGEEGKGVAVAASADVTKEEDCRRIVDLALEQYGRVDILVNNVGVRRAQGHSSRGRHGGVGQGDGDQCREYGDNGQVCDPGHAAE